MVSGSTPALGRSVPRLAGRLLERMWPLAGRNKPCRARGAPDGTRGGRTPRDRFVAKPRLFMKYSLVAVLILLVLAVSASAQDHGGLIGADAPAGKPYIYKQSLGEPREMEIFFPPNHDPAKSRAPSLILFPGGNWVGGSLAQFRVACAYFASRGMVFATANYRMLTKDEAKKLPPGESRKRVCVTDAKSAIRWFKQQARELGFNPERLVVGGASAGGHISALATLNPKLNDPSDLEDLEDLDIRPGPSCGSIPPFRPRTPTIPRSMCSATSRRICLRHWCFSATRILGKKAGMPCTRKCARWTSTPWNCSSHPAKTMAFSTKTPFRPRPSSPPTASSHDSVC